MVFPRQIDLSLNASREVSSCAKPDDAFLQLSEELSLAEEAESAEYANGTELYKRADVTINTYVHIVAASKKPVDGWVSDEAVHKQMKVINDAFKGRNIGFHLADISRKVDRDLATVKDGEPTSKLGNKLRKGNYATLNLYIVKDMPRNVAGDCTFPVSNPGPSYPNDGCRFNSNTLPSKSDGKVLIHEIGHWLGLMHTFQEGPANPTCGTGHGDQVKDTPVHLMPKSADFECKAVDTCPGKKGKDPVGNYMNYTPTKCWTHFTKGQARRMHNMFQTRKKHQ
ncbi:uncharacterized protein N0V89_000136 [Didymosphaeria variabile]|uniref:Peptidase M43 pregnancy-associated plasma-A domain-containing protein n=1 Tax=Didymosphaeria variabile TaxID=1932322 RepID=A0A9W8XUN3_9PLEO|nr:uncharacterized protein N0V89_000136 [Didymosphaeria variabile]KAJ4359581.1 hypothetical protein N0V89_000136 [Didymosphaeria variabile]